MLIRQPIGCWGGESESDYPNKKDLEAAGRELNLLHQKYRDLKRMRDMERATRTLELRIQLKVLNSEIDLTYAPSLAEIVRQIAAWKWYTKSRKSEKPPDWFKQHIVGTLHASTPEKELV